MCKPSQLKFEYIQDSIIRELKLEFKFIKAKFKKKSKLLPKKDRKSLDLHFDLIDIKKNIKEHRKAKKRFQQEANNEGLHCKCDGVNYFWKSVRLFLLDCDNKESKWLSTPGVYIIVNARTLKAYCGRTTIKINKRPKKHFLGGGNPDVKRDYENGDKFVINVCGLDGFTKKEINEFETIGIEAVWENRYNRKKGDRFT